AAGSPSEGAVTLKSEPQEPPVLSEFSAVVQHLLQRKVEPPTSSCQQVVSGDAAELKPLGRGQTGSRPAQTTGSTAGVTPVRSRFNVAPRAAGVPRAASTPISSKAPKFRKTNYTWVANPAKCSRPVRRWVSPRPSENPRKGTGAAERAAKPSPRDVGAKLKKSVVQTKAGVCASKYKWKASNLQASPSTSRSAFRWRCEDQKKPPALSLPLTGTVPLPPGAAAVGPSAVKPVGAAALSSYKVRSRTKIIKRKGNLGSPTEKKSSSSSTTPLKSHFHLRKKVLRGKTSTPLKRSSPKGLVHITKHRLCRLQVSTKEGRNTPLRGPSA
ncbi:ZC3H3 protein, partial [Upupa epops]|nr:ZC3H3 protein [Upupa epops]